MTDQAGVWLIGGDMIGSERVPQMTDTVVHQGVLPPAASCLSSDQDYAGAEYDSQQQRKQYLSHTRIVARG